MSPRCTATVALTTVNASLQQHRGGDYPTILLSHSRRTLVLAGWTLYRVPGVAGPSPAVEQTDRQAGAPLRWCQTASVPGYSHCMQREEQPLDSFCCCSPSLAGVAPPRVQGFLGPPLVPGRPVRRPAEVEHKGLGIARVLSSSLGAQGGEDPEELDGPIESDPKPKHFS